MLKIWGVSLMLYQNIRLYKNIIFFALKKYEQIVNRKPTKIAPVFYSRKGAKNALY